MQTERFPAGSLEDIDYQKRLTTARRVRTLSVITLLCLGARFLIKDPKPPQAPPRTTPIKIAPGVLKSLPQHVRDKLDPQVVASLERADREALYGKEAALARVPYKPAETPLRNEADEEAYRKEVYVYTQRKLQIEAEKQKIVLAREITKPMLVRFRRGGYITAEQARLTKNNVEIFYDKTILAS